MSTGRRLLRGAAWIYGAQVFSVVAQVAYAAITSRLATPAEFGDYSIALTATGLISVLAAGGLAQSVGRMQALPQSLLSSVASFAALLGAAGCAVTLILARPLAEVWGAPGAASVIALLSLNALTAPLFGFLTGLLRRTGRFRRLASYTLLANLGGMVIGAATVYSQPSAESLAVSSVVAQQGMVIMVAIAVRSQLRFGRVRWASDEIAFSWRITIATLLQYAGGNVVRWSAARSLGPEMVGQWNRAEVLATLPFQQLQAVMVQVIYPEFRHDRSSSERARRVWSDLLGLVAWATWPIGAVAAALLPVVIPVLFGPGWEAAALFSIPLALAGGLQPVHMLLVSAVEAVGRFRIIWFAGLLQLILQGALALAVVLTQQPMLAVSSLLLANLVGHALFVGWSSRRGFLNLRQLSRHYLQVATASIVAGAATAGLVWYVLVDPSAFGALTVTGFCATALTIMVLNRNRLPPVALARKLGLFRAG